MVRIPGPVPPGGRAIGERPAPAGTVILKLMFRMATGVPGRSSLYKYLFGSYLRLNPRRARLPVAHGVRVKRRWSRNLFGAGGRGRQVPRTIVAEMAPAVSRAPASSRGSSARTSRGPGERFAESGGAAHSACAEGGPDESATA